MFAPLLKLAVVLQALLLALPPGWCCAIAWPTGKTVAGGEAASGNTGETVRPCCHARMPSRPGDADRNSAPSRPTPVRPAAECCCSRVATTPPRLVHQTDDDALPLYVDLPIANATVLSGQRDTVQCVHPAGPRLHVLKCVWRC
jgi:hypothetical protein